jgi:hypothetical protein
MTYWMRHPGLRLLEEIASHLESRGATREEAIQRATKWIKDQLSRKIRTGASGERKYGRQ